jgi:hypothetical protein
MRSRSRRRAAVDVTPLHRGRPGHSGGASCKMTRRRVVHHGPPPPHNHTCRSEEARRPPRAGLLLRAAARRAFHHRHWAVVESHPSSGDFGHLMFERKANATGSRLMKSPIEKQMQGSRLMKHDTSRERGKRKLLMWQVKTHNPCITISWLLIG